VHQDEVHAFVAPVIEDEVVGGDPASRDLTELAHQRFGQRVAKKFASDTAARAELRTLTEYKSL